MNIRNLLKKAIPFLEVFITALIIIVIISINRGVLYEHRLKTMEYPKNYTAIGVSVNTLSAQSWSPWELYDRLLQEENQTGVITYFMDYYNEIIKQPTIMKELEGFDSYKNAQLIGTDNQYFEYFQPNLRTGRYFGNDENGEMVCVIGEDLAKGLYGTIEDSIGQTLELPYLLERGYKESLSDVIVFFDGEEPKAKTFNLNIIGVLKGSEKLPAKSIDMLGENVERVNVFSDNVILFPARAMEGSKLFMNLHSTIWIDSDINQGKKLASELSMDNPDLRFTVNPELETFFQSSFTEKIALVILNMFVVLVFFVAGMGIMGIQLITVGRRQEEIGLRMALGANRWNILILFLKETLVKFLIPSIAGIIVGLLSLPSISKVLGIPTLMDVQTVIICTLISALFAITVGLYPALKAAFLDPIKAMGRAMGLH